MIEEPMTWISKTQPIYRFPGDKWMKEPEYQVYHQTEEGWSNSIQTIPYLPKSKNCDLSRMRKKFKNRVLCTL